MICKAIVPTLFQRAPPQSYAPRDPLFFPPFLLLLQSSRPRPVSAQALGACADCDAAGLHSRSDLLLLPLRSCWPASFLLVIGALFPAPTLLLSLAPSCRRRPDPGQLLQMMLLSIPWRKVQQKPRYNHPPRLLASSATKAPLTSTMTMWWEDYDEMPPSGSLCECDHAAAGEVGHLFCAVHGQCASCSFHRQ